MVDARDEYFSRQERFSRAGEQRRERLFGEIGDGDDCGDPGRTLEVSAAT